MAEGRIIAVESGRPGNGAELQPPRGGCIIPGLIDLQVNGAGGVDFTAPGRAPAALGRVATLLARHGVTAFCPTIISAVEPTILESLRTYGSCRPAGAAESLGLHVEGPFLHPEFRGVHDLSALRQATALELARWLAMARPTIVTLAPELPGALEAIRTLTDAGVVVSLGHSGATMEQGRTALDAGARLGTHLFNAMAPFHHRHPGLVGALLADDRAMPGLIADGVHLHPATFGFAVRVVGPMRAMLVSDAVAAAGQPPGPSRIGEQHLIADGQSARRPDGTLGGGALLLDACLRNARTWSPWLSEAQVVQLATETPARALGPAVAARKGRVAPGYDADLAVLDEDWNVVATVVRGEIVHP